MVYFGALSHDSYDETVETRRYSDYKLTTTIHYRNVVLMLRTGHFQTSLQQISLNCSGSLGHLHRKPLIEPHFVFVPRDAVR
jgi:hypothetical protein